VYTVNTVSHLTMCTAY